MSGSHPTGEDIPGDPWTPPTMMSEDMKMNVTLALSSRRSQADGAP